jgi:folate-dependent phosphoribosylglycinamide formyltransferase PurN
MAESRLKPSVVLLCHEDDPLDVEGLSAWLATSMRLVGVVAIRSSWKRSWRAVRRQFRRTGFTGLIDVLAFRLYYRMFLAAGDAAWTRGEITRLQRIYPGRPDQAAQLQVTDPNDREVRTFLEALRPDLVIARCKVLLRPEIFDIARAGTFALHPGICPEYRNAHGCFWALVHRDRSRVGMTVLKIDRGVDTGAVFLHASCACDEVRDTHITIQHRVVTESLDAIADVLEGVARGRATPLRTDGRASAVWGQPTLSAYLRWKRAARRERQHAAHLTAVP